MADRSISSTNPDDTMERYHRSIASLTAYEDNLICLEPEENAQRLRRELNKLTDNDIIVCHVRLGLNPQGSMATLRDRLERHRLRRMFGPNAAAWNPERDESPSIHNMSQESLFGETNHTRTPIRLQQSNTSSPNRSMNRSYLPTGQTGGEYRDPLTMEGPSTNFISQMDIVIGQYEGNSEHGRRVSFDVSREAIRPRPQAQSTQFHPSRMLDSSSFRDDRHAVAEAHRVIPETMSLQPDRFNIPTETSTVTTAVSEATGLLQLPRPTVHSYGTSPHNDAQPTVSVGQNYWNQRHAEEPRDQQTTYFLPPTSTIPQSTMQANVVVTAAPEPNMNLISAKPKPAKRQKTLVRTNSSIPEKQKTTTEPTPKSEIASGESITRIPTRRRKRQRRKRIEPIGSVDCDSVAPRRNLTANHATANRKLQLKNMRNKKEDVQWRKQYEPCFRCKRIGHWHRECINAPVRARDGKPNTIKHHCPISNPVALSRAWEEHSDMVVLERATAKATKRRSKNWREIPNQPSRLASLGDHARSPCKDIITFSNKAKNTYSAEVAETVQEIAYVLEKLSNKTQVKDFLKYLKKYRPRKKTTAEATRAKATSLSSNNATAKKPMSESHPVPVQKPKKAKGSARTVDHTPQRSQASTKPPIPLLRARSDTAQPAKKSNAAHANSSSENAAAATSMQTAKISAASNARGQQPSRLSEKLTVQPQIDRLSLPEAKVLPSVQTPRRHHGNVPVMLPKLEQEATSPAVAAVIPALGTLGQLIESKAATDCFVMSKEDLPWARSP